MTMLQIRMRYTCVDATPVQVSTLFSSGSKVFKKLQVHSCYKSACIARDQFLCAITNSVVSDPPQIASICDVVAQLIYLPNSRRVYMLTTSRSILLGTKKCDWHEKKKQQHYAASTWDTPRHPALALSHSNFKRFRSPTFCRLCKVMYVLRAVSQFFWQRPRLHHLRFPLNSYHFKAWALGRPTVWDATMDYVHLIFSLCTSTNDGYLELFGPSGWDDQLQ